MVTGCAYRPAEQELLFATEMWWFLDFATGAGGVVVLGRWVGFRLRKDCGVGFG